MTLRSLLVLLLAVAFAAAPLLAPPFTGYPSETFPVALDRPAIQPAGVFFSIWTIIYAWLIAHAGFGFWRRAKSLDWDETRLPLATALGLGALWLFIAPWAPLAATIVIVIMLVAALSAFFAADEFYDRWLLSGPIGLFAGWLSAASAVSVGTLMAGYGLLSNTESAYLMLALVLGASALVQFLRPEMPSYGLAVIWALTGVVIANLQSHVFVAGAAAAAASAMGALLLWQWRRRRPSLAA